MTSQLHAYIDAWRHHDVPGVLATLTDDCVVIESYGPVYRGRARVEQWMHAWFDAGGVVDGWDLTSYSRAGEVLVAEWRFSCTWQGRSTSFDGATVATLRDDKIVHLREYVTTAPLYDWSGTWRD